MSKSIKHEKTHGYLDELSRTRRHRSLIRQLKSELIDEQLFLDLFPTIIPAQDF